LILDKNLRIKNANSCFYKTFEVTEEETQGRLLYDIGNRQWDIPRLKELLEDVIPRNAQVTDFEVIHTFQHIGEKIMLLNGRRLIRKTHGEHLLLIAIEDITEFAQAQRMIAEREEWFRSTADNAPSMIWVAGIDKKNVFLNKAWLEYRGMKLKDAIGKDWMEDMHPDDQEDCRKIYNESFKTKKPFTVQYRLLHFADKKYHLILSEGKPNYDHKGVFLGYIGSCMVLPPPNLIK
jgi:two-component system CheB/CheR fusion protein